MIDRRQFLARTGAASLAATSGALLIAPRRAAAEGITRDTVFHDPDAPAIGNPEGDVTLVEYFDYQCPFCKRNHPVLEALIAEDPGLRVVLKDWPVFGAVSLRASQLALGAEAAGGYRAAMTALMATPGRLNEAQVDKALRGAGVEPKAAQDGYRARRKTIDALLIRNDQQAVGLGLFGTPGFVTGVSVYPGAMDKATLARAIAEARRL